jgi:hypothetical protein
MIRFPIPDDFALPAMYRAHQRFDIPPKIEVENAVDWEWNRINGGLSLPTGARIAVGVGSRGISNISEIVRTVVDRLKAVEVKPFIVPAMGSHGGARPEGQIKLLSHLGITEKKVGAPVEADMSVVSLGTADGIPLYQSRPAYNADGFVLINRVKSHTDFTGPVESGLIKMLTIGMGNRQGADLYHRMAFNRGFYGMIITAGRALLKKSKFLFGVALVENQRHETCDLRMATAVEVENIEIELLKKARRLLPKLPLEEIDLLIVDEIGKNISGAGLDPNVVGSSLCSWSDRRPSPISAESSSGASRKQRLETPRASAWSMWPPLVWWTTLIFKSPG